MWIQFDDAHLTALKEVVEDAIIHSNMTRGHSTAADMIAARIAHFEANDCNDPRFIDALEAMGLDENDYDLDDQPVVSASDDGAYVMLWRWVSNEEAGIDEEDEGEDWSCDNCGETAQDGSGICITCGQDSDEEGEADV